MVAHAVFQMVASWLFSIAYGVFASAAAILTFGRFSHSLTPKLLRFWGRTMLWIAGVRIELHGAEHLNAPTGKVALFNHSSMLDAFLVTAIMPPGSVAAIKREALYYPGVGLGLYCLGFLLIDRGNTDRARKTLARAAERIAGEKLTVFIAPEGTRTRDGALLPFKRGAFHLAVESQTPLLPVVFRGAFESQPYGRWWSIPGLVRIHVLPPVSTVGFTVDQVGELSDQLRARFEAIR